LLDPRKTKIVLGSPGTGKTTALLNEIADLIKAGADPKRIAFLAFTRKAAREARTRAMERFSVSEKELVNFRTIHSLAFRQTGASGNRLLKKLDYQKMADEIGGFDYRGEGPTDEILPGVEGDALFFLDNLARVTGRTLEETWQRKLDRKLIDDGLSFEDLERTREVVKRYKARTGLIDFNDPLEEFAATGAAPGVDWLIVDECQDLSHLQFAAIERIAAKVKKIIFSGDDQQAIFSWNGADMDTFLSLEGEVVVLDQSYRLPRLIHELAVKVGDRISRRREKKFAPKKGAEGAIDLIADEKELDAGSGTWLFLTRHVFQLAALEDFCREEGWIYERNGEASNSSDGARAVMTWENLRRGAEVRVSEAKELVQFLPRGSSTARGVEAMAAGRRPEDRIQRDPAKGELAPWTEVLTELPDEDHRYFRLARQNGEKLAVLDKTTNRFEPAPPRITISTIHGAKGGEADGVLLLTDISESTAAGMEIDADDEHRVFYVGASRAKERLAIRRPRTRLSYPIVELAEGE
jgi:DNA helicase-2/ATP-dependent DNA helicase PcrA